MRRPSLRTLAIGVLFVVGIASVSLFGGGLDNTSVSLDATQVEPASDAALIANASSDVAGFDNRIQQNGAIERAARTGSFEGDLDTEVRAALDSVEAPYVVYEGRYYRWNATFGEPTRISMQPVEPAIVVSDVATPYSVASDDVQRAIETGSTDGQNISSGLYVRDDTYYVVEPASFGEIVGLLGLAAVAIVLFTVGQGWIAVALGLAVVRYRNPVARPVSSRHALGVVALAVPVGVVVSLLGSSGPAARAVVPPAIAVVVAGGFAAGVFARQSRWLALVGFTVGLPVATVVVSAVAAGVGAAFLAVLGVFPGIAAGILPFGYGLAFAADVE